MPDAPFPPDRESVLQLAIAEHQAGRHAEAKKHLLPLIDALPGDAAALYQLGLAEFELGNLDASIRLMEGAIAADPSSADYHFDLAVAFWRRRKFDAAAEAFRNTACLRPDFMKAYIGIVKSLAMIVRDSGVNSPEIATTDPGASNLLGQNRSLSVIICSVDERKRERIRRHYESLLAGRTFELIVIPDAKSLCEGYNRAFRRSSGDVILFSHDDIEITSRDFPSWLLHYLAMNDVVGIAGASRLTGVSWVSAGWPHLHGCAAHRSSDGLNFDFFGPPSREPRLQTLDGVFFAAHRKVCEMLPFDEDSFDGFHFYDLDFTFRAFKAGCRISVAPEILVLHESVGARDANWRHFAARFIQKYRHEIPFRGHKEKRYWPAALLTTTDQLRAFHQRLLVTTGGIVL
jgi:tetratricopeptide (TPR) repeat protein